MPRPSATWARSPELRFFFPIPYKEFFPMSKDKTARLNRLLTNGRCLDIALDHGVCNEPSFLDGLEDMPQVMEKLLAAGPDAIQLNYGQSDLLQDRPGRNKPALVMRIDMGNPYNATLHRVMWAQLQNEHDPVLPAVQRDAACVVVNLFMLPNEPDLFRQCVQNIARVRADCDRYGMPLMIEPLVMQSPTPGSRYQVDGDAEKIVTLVRLAREMGADIVKADPTSDPKDFHRVVQAARCPVLVRGGGREDLQQVFARSRVLLDQGAVGMVYGRNVYQHANPSAVVSALMAMIHRGASAEAAWALYESDGAK
jgi:class I fructose-bisphosphate aldolase